MQKVFKYPLEIANEQYVGMPSNATILSVQVQDGAVFIWAIVDPSAKLELRKFEVLGTGEPIQYLYGGLERSYIGTVQLDDFVWHVFEIKENK